MIADSKVPRLIAFIILIFFYTPGVWAFETFLSIYIDIDWVKITVKAEDLEGEKIIASLEEGLTAEIFFQFRVYNINRGFFSFLGDRLVLEKKLSYIAFKDFFLKQYVIQTGDNQYKYFNNVDDFLNSFLTLTEYNLIETHNVNQSEYYILARTSINPVKLEPPLHIIALFSSIGRTSAWVEYRFSEPKGDQR